MKVFEAIAILNSLDSDQEVTLKLNVPVKVLKPEPLLPKNVGFYGPTTQTPYWIGQQEFWPNRNEVTCKMH